MRRALAIALLLAALPAPARPDGPPAPRLTFGGEASGTFSPEDPTFFNYTDYEYTALRLGRLALAGSLRLGPRVSVLAEARSDNLGEPRVHGLYLRVRPWEAREIDLQAGLVPPVFGAFARRNYAADNFLIGYPLAYQYLTSLRADALPVTESDLVRMRGRGWRPSFPVGSQSIGPGLPMVSTLRWDTGVQARAASARWEGLVAVTAGTLSSPRVRDDNGGKQVSARLGARPVAGLVLGASAARGAYVDAHALEGLSLDPDRLRQRALGLDAEYSRGYWLVRGEAVWSAWDVPALAAPAVQSPLKARAISVEGRYKILPGLYAAARYDHLGFDRLERAGVSWDAPVTRVEAGLGYAVHRHVLVKTVYQHNRRDGGRMRSLGVMAGQVLCWF